MATVTGPQLRVLTPRRMLDVSVPVYSPLTRTPTLSTPRRSITLRTRSGAVGVQRVVSAGSRVSGTTASRSAK
jgi:hypothetical protein